MKLEVFTEIINSIQRQNHIETEAYSIGIDLINFTDEYSKIYTLLLRAYYGQEGEDWISWYIFERDHSSDEAQAWDENKNPICYDIPSLWKHVEEIRCSDDFKEYELPTRSEIGIDVFENFFGKGFSQ